MNRYELSRYERETTIRWSEADSTAYIYTASDIDARRYDKMCRDYPDAMKCVWVDPHGYGKKYECDKHRIVIRKPPSEARRAAARHNFSKQPLISRDETTSNNLDDKQ